MKKNQTIHFKGVDTGVPAKVTIRQGKIKGVYLTIDIKDPVQKAWRLNEAKVTAHHTLFKEYSICPNHKEKYLLAFDRNFFHCPKCKERYTEIDILSWMYHPKEQPPNTSIC